MCIPLYLKYKDIKITIKGNVECIVMLTHRKIQNGISKSLNVREHGVKLCSIL